MSRGEEGRLGTAAVDSKVTVDAISTAPSRAAVACSRPAGVARAPCAKPHVDRSGGRCRRRIGIGGERAWPPLGADGRGVAGGPRLSERSGAVAPRQRRTSPAPGWATIASRRSAPPGTIGVSTPVGPAHQREIQRRRRRDRGSRVAPRRDSARCRSVVGVGEQFEHTAAAGQPSADAQERGLHQGGRGVVALPSIRTSARQTRHGGRRNARTARLTSRSSVSGCSRPSGAATHPDRRA